jgi:hypothetical protein
MVRKADADNFWQSTQWQIPTDSGSNSASYMIAPQWQLPSIIMALQVVEIEIKKYRNALCEYNSEVFQKPKNGCCREIRQNRVFNLTPMLIPVSPTTCPILLLLIFQRIVQQTTHDHETFSYVDGF